MWEESLSGCCRLKKRKHNLLESVLFLTIVVIAAYVILRSPYFDVRQVVVTGNQYLAEEVILAATPINAGENIFGINVAGATEELKKVPMVKEARISRDLPATLLINVTERRPLGILPTGGGFVEVDEEGMCLQRSGAGVPGLPVITGIAVEMVAPGDFIQNELLMEALAVIGELPQSVTEDLSEVHIDSDGQVKVYTMGQITCYFGEVGEIKEKGEVLAQVLSEISELGLKVEYINVSSPDKPVLKYK